MNKIELLSHQYDFVTDFDHRYVCLHAGYGSGKTFAFCMKAIKLAELNVGFKGMLCEPTNDLINQILIPALEEALEITQIPYTLKKSPLPELTLHFNEGKTTILMRSGENFQRLIGVNLAFAGVDELDTIDKQTASMMWKRLQGRLRSGRVFQMFCTSTPEGKKFMYEFFIKQPAQDQSKQSDRKTYHAATKQNPYLPKEFIEDLRKNYTIEEQRAYLEGEFVDFSSGRVYYKYDRYLNNSELTVDFIRDHAVVKQDMYGNKFKILPPLEIGMDFNIGKMAAVVHVILPDGPHAIAEIVDVLDTPAMIREIKRLFPEFKINVYPDSSGKSRDTANASITDISLLEQAGFKVNAPLKNPPVKDRIQSMNVAFCNHENKRLYKINSKKCPRLCLALEEQTYDNEGEPVKDNEIDHILDAAGYFIHYKYPIIPYKHGRLKLTGF